MTAVASRPCKQCGKPIIDVAITKEDGSPGRQVLDAKAPVYVLADGFMQEVRATRQKTAFVTHFATCASANDFARKGGRPSLVDENEDLRKKLQTALDRVAVLEGAK